MRRSVTFIVVSGGLVVAAIWFALHRRQTSVPRATIAYVPDRVTGEDPGRWPAMAPTPAPAPETARAPSGLDRALGPPKWHARPDGEWQGMLVNLNVQPPCDGPGLCGMARACKNGRCGPCEFDAECAPGESCVLDHCVLSANVRCRRRADCEPRSSCVLSGYSGGVRGNQDMRAYCVAPESGADRPPRASPEGPPPKDPRARLPDDDLLKAAANARAQ
jgi:hypothetical protein